MSYYRNDAIVSGVRVVQTGGNSAVKEGGGVDRSSLLFLAVKVMLPFTWMGLQSGQQ